MNQRIRLGLVSCISLAAAGLASTDSLLAQITVTGVADRTVYTDRASFTVPAPAGFDTKVLLNGAPEPAGATVEVNDANYYELSVERKSLSTGTTESLLLRFIVKASRFADTEWGLPAWIPYPDIDSAEAEYAGSHLKLVVPPRFPKGIMIPAVAWVETDAGKRVGVNGVVRSAAFPAGDLRLHRGVGVALLPAPAAGGDVDYDWRVGPLQGQRTIAIEEAPAWQSASGAIAASVDWGEEARVDVTGTVTVAAGATLTIGAGSVVRLAPGADLVVNGTILVHGTLDRPVVFTPNLHTAPWGGFILRATTSVAEMDFAMITGGCADANWFGNNPGSGGTHLAYQALLYLGTGAHATLNDCYLFDSKGQAGHGENSFLTMNRSLFTRFYTGGEYNGGQVKLDGCATIEFPLYGSPFGDDDNDAIYFTSGPHSVTNHLSGWCHDDALDSGSGAGAGFTIKGNWHESAMHEAFAWSSDSGVRAPDIRDSVTINCDQGDESGWGNPQVVETHCLHTGNITGARLGDNYDWTYTGSLNITGSLILYNYRNVWAQTWDKDAGGNPLWSTHLADVHLSGCYLSAADPHFPAANVWDPVADAALLEPFLPTPATTVGIGIATWSDSADLAEASRGVPVRLSTFTTHPVTVDYSIDGDGSPVSSGALTFTAGETVKLIAMPDLTGRSLIQVTISSPAGADLTGRSVMTYRQPLILVSFGAVWKYYDKGQLPGAGWQALVFDDHAWSQGAGELGYGDGGEQTVINGGPTSNRYPACYFRHQFEVPDPTAIAALTINLVRDDGAVVYLNGKEVFRSNMPAGAIAYGTWAPVSIGGADESAINSQSVAASDLVAGTNLLAVEVHQVNATSSDVSFNLELRGDPAVSQGPRFVRGDANGDRTIDISDALGVLFYLYAGAPSDCLDALDVDDLGDVGITDAIAILEFLFQGGAEPEAPFPAAGADPTEDNLDCQRG